MQRSQRCSPEGSDIKGVTHQAFAVTLAALAMNAGGLHISPWVGLPLASFGSLIPDIDHPESKLGRRVYPLSSLLFQFAGHRGFFHSLVFWGMMTFAFYLANSYLGQGYLPEAWLLISIGHLSHLLGDMFFGRHGVQLLWPIRRRIRIVPGSWSVGGVHEFLFLCLFVVITAYVTGASI